MKKVVSLLLVVVLALGMSTMAFAKIDGVVRGLDETQIQYPRTEANGGTFYPDEKIVLPIDPNNIFSDDVTGMFASPGITKAQLKTNKVTVKTRLAKGSNVIDKVEFTSSTASAPASVQIVFIDPYVNANDDGQDFEVNIYFQVGNYRYDNFATQISGNFVNRTVNEIDVDTDYVNLDGGFMVEAIEYSKNVEYYLGNGVSIFGKAFKDKFYYGYSTMEATEAQETVMDKYGIDEVYNLKTVGLQGVANHVVLENTDADAYVYDAELNYLGQGKDELPYSAVYFLASKKLDVDEEEDDEPYDEPEEEDDVPEAPPITGGYDDIENENANPSTGK